MVHDSPDRLVVAFDDERVVANAGILLAVTLGQRLGLEALVEEIVDLGGRPGAARPGRKVLSLVHAMLLGADSIDDCDVLRAGRTEAVLGHQAMAASTLGTFLRSFTFGHVRQLDQVLATALARAPTDTSNRAHPDPPRQPDPRTPDTPPQNGGFRLRGRRSRTMVLV